MTDPEAHAFLERKVAEIHEHFEAVQILISFVDTDGSTSCISKGRGNWYARKAMCQEVVERDQAQQIAYEISRSGPPPEGDEWKADKP